MSYRAQLDLADGQVTPTVTEQLYTIVLIELHQLRYRSEYLQIKFTGYLD